MQQYTSHTISPGEVHTRLTGWSVTFSVKKALEYFEVSVYISASALTLNEVCWKVPGIYTVEIGFLKSLLRRHTPFSYLAGCAETFQRHEEYLSVWSPLQWCASVHLYGAEKIHTFIPQTEERHAYIMIMIQEWKEPRAEWGVQSMVVHSTCIQHHLHQRQRTQERQSRAHRLQIRVMVLSLISHGILTLFPHPHEWRFLIINILIDEQICTTLVKMLTVWRCLQRNKKTSFAQTMTAADFVPWAGQG